VVMIGRVFDHLQSGNGELALPPNHDPLPLAK